VSASRTGLGHTEVGGRYQLFNNGSWVLSAQATARIPGTRDNVNPATFGYTDFEGDLRVLLGHNYTVAGMPAFFDLQFAHRFFEGGPPSDFRADVTFGLHRGARWMMLAQFFNVMSNGAGEPPFPSYEYYKFQLSSVYAITPKVALQVGGFTTYAG